MIGSWLNAVGRWHGTKRPLRVRSALAHFYPGEARKALCGMRPHDDADLVPEDLERRGAMRCAECARLVYPRRA